MVAELISSPQSETTLAEDTGAAREIYCLVMELSIAAVLLFNPLTPVSNQWLRLLKYI
jgi:hypothetical protein